LQNFSTYGIVAGNMELDIIRKIKLNDVKASFETLALKHKFFLIICLFSLISTILPHETFAAIIQQTQKDPGPVLVFDGSNTDYQDYLDQISADLTDKYYQEQLRQKQLKQDRLVKAVRKYLEEQGSPLATYTPILLTLRNWKKIVALSNAESGMCEHYQVATANCWGVGGAQLWDMGNNLGEGIVYMNKFLSNYPKHSSTKYAQMSFEQMNGLYKQPAARHWLDNNTIVYDDLSAIEASSQ
jgi:hypothetical protein